MKQEPRNIPAIGIARCPTTESLPGRGRDKGFRALHLWTPWIAESFNLESVCRWWMERATARPTMSVNRNEGHIFLSIFVDY